MSAKPGAPVPALREALQAMVTSFERAQYPSWEKGLPDWNGSLKKARAALASVEAPTEPSLVECAHPACDCSDMGGGCKADDQNDEAIRNGEVTDEQILAVWANSNPTRFEALSFARAILALNPEPAQQKKPCALCWGTARIGTVCDACHDSMGTKPAQQANPVKLKYPAQRTHTRGGPIPGVAHADDCRCPACAAQQAVPKEQP